MVSTRPDTKETDSNCIVRSVASALTSDPTLEAVTIDREQKKIAVATLGKVDDAAIVCGAFGLAGYFLQSRGLALPCFIASYVAGGWYTAEEVWERLRKRAIDVHFLMLAVAAGSASIGAWAEGSTLLFLFSLSGALEHFALGRTQREIRSLFRDAPKTATLLGDHGEESEIAVDALKTGMRLLIKPGEQ